MRPRVSPGLARIWLGAALAGAASMARAEAQPAGAGERIESSVVQVFATRQVPEPLKPWTKHAPEKVSGSGVVVEGKRILTSAHIVLYASQVEVQANRAGDRLSASVEFIAPGIDLAVLKLDDEGFFGAHRPLERAKGLPSVKDAVMVYGFPAGGTSLSITKGIVSRIEFTAYNWPVSGLRIQIDAAVNPGNSGGPALAGDKVVGLVLGHFGGGQNISYIVPSEEIELFLNDIADGRYDGKPALFDEFQTLESDALRSFLRLDRSVEGVVVRQPHQARPAYPLERWDVVSRIGGRPIDDQGRIEISGGIRVSFRYLVQVLASGGTVPLTVWRGGKELSVQVPVSPRNPRLIADLQGAYPSYFVYGPLVLSTATSQFIAAIGPDRKSQPAAFRLVAGPLLSRILDPPGFADEQLVVVSSPLFPHNLSKGYGNPVARVVRAVNGVPVNNLLHLVAILRDCTDEFVAFELAGRYGEDLVFRRREMVAATDQILGDNGIRAQGSPDAMAVWNAKRAAGKAP